jgi:hypothetical protein
VKTRRIFSTVSVALLLTIMTSVLTGAQGFGVSWTSSFQVLNLDDSNPATISMTYYEQDGSLASMATGYSNPDNDTVSAGGSNTYFPVHAAEGFGGSVVIASDRQLAVISNLVANSTASAIGSYVGSFGGAGKIYYPLVMKGNGNQDTVFTVQNTGAADVTFRIDFTPEVGKGYSAISSKTDTVAMGAAHSYDVTTMSEFSGVTKWVGSATVEVTSPSGGTVAGVATIVNRKQTTAYGLYTYNAFTAGSTTVVAPLIQENNGGNRTSINCQNISGTTTTITTNYTPEPGLAAKASESRANIGANGIAVFLQDYGGSTKFVGSAEISSSPAVDLVCVINQQKPATGRASAYEGFDPDSATSKVVLPLVQSRNGNDSKGYVWASINVASKDGSAAAVTCDFRPEPGISDPPNVSKTQAVSVFLLSDVFGTGAKFVGGAVCTADKPIFAIVNQTRSGGPHAIRDVLSSYNGFNVTP